MENPDITIRAILAPRETKGFNPVSIPSTPSLSSHPRSQKAQSSSSWGLQVPSMLNCRSTLRTGGDHLSAWNGRAILQNPPINNRDTCIHNGMVSMLWKFSHLRPLVSARKVATHKLSRTSSRCDCPEIISKKQEQHPCKTNDGPYNSNKLYKQNGWADIIGPVKATL